MKGGEVLHDEFPPMNVDHVDELVGIHTHDHLVLAYAADLTGKVRRAAMLQEPERTVTELLRLARIGAIAEAEARKDGTKPVRVVVHEARRRWRLELGIV